MAGGKYGRVQADALEGGVGALPLRQGLHELRQVPAGLGVEAMRGAELAGDVEAGILGVDGDDLGEARDLGRLQRQQADHARPDDQIGRAHV